MLLCRRIHQAHAFNSQRLIQPHVRNIPVFNPSYSHASLVTRECFPEATSQSSTLGPCDPHPDPRPALLERVLHVSRYSVPKAAKDSEPVVEQVMSKKTKNSPFDAYAKLRAQNHTLSASLPTDVLCRLAEGAVKHGSQDIVDSLATDVLDDQLLHQEQRVEVAASLLCVPRRYYRLLDKQMTLSLLTIIHGNDPLFALPAPAVLHITKTITDDSSLDTLNRSLLNFVLCPFLEHLASLEPPVGAEAISYRPPEAISLAYTLIDKFVSLKWYHETFDLFQTLSDHGHVPAEAFLTEVPSPLAHDFAVIVRSTLARACLHWDWHHRGVGLIASIMKSQDSLKQDLEPLALELLHSALEKCSPVQFKACAWLMSHLVDPHCGVIIPTRTIRLFYSRAMRVGDYEAAHTFYSHTQSRRVKMMTDYPLPQGAALTWLMRYLVGHKHDVHLARSLAKQAVDMMEPIPRYDRGRFIALAATQGFATEARALWERYSIGGGRAFVVGNAGTMLRVVSLFARRSWTQMKMQRNGADGSATDFHQFARRVLESFRETILPLEEANHFDLSALARGYFMLGETVEGFRPLRILVGRREIPDRHDMNIALSAMARQSPRAASRMVNRMADEGLRPDGVTFGTVLHEAIVQGDADLVTEMLDRARDIGVSLSPKTMVSLILARVGGKDKKQLEANVRWAWGVVCSAKEGSVVHSPNVGKHCIAACLEVEDPVMAFQFWARLMRGKTEWGDPEQRRQRRAIGALVRRHCAEGRLDRESGQTMLLKLGDLDEARQSQSCDACRARKVRCVRENTDDHKQPCKHCVALGVPCTYEYQPKKRGPPNLYLRRLQTAAQHSHPETRDNDVISPISPHRTPSSPHQEPFQSPISPSRHLIVPDSFHYSSVNSAESEPYSSSSTQNWSYKHHQPLTMPTAIPPLSYHCRPHCLEDIAPRDTMALIIALFFDFVYPLTPCIHKPSFMADLHAHREEHDPLFFALVMSTVASTLVQMPRSYLPMQRSVVCKLAQTCYEASRHITVVSYDPLTSTHIVIRYFDSIYHFCLGHEATQHAAFGEAVHIAITLRIHEEASYQGLGPIECEVRRRSFWLLFGADKSMSILLGRPICLRDEDCTVHFPKEIDDEYITPSAYLPQPHGKIPIVSGLNYISRIFALLGEILVRIRVDKRSPPQGQFATARLEEVQSLHSRILGTLVHAPEPLRLKHAHNNHLPAEYGSAGFRQATFAEVKDFFDNPKASRANALNPFLVMQANLYVTQQLVRFVIEQYRDELVTSLQGKIDERQIAEDREAVASDLLNILHSIPIQSIATNGPSLVHKVRFVASTLLDAVSKAETAPASAARAHAFLWDFLSILSEIERNYLLDDDQDVTSSERTLPSMI